MSEQADLLPFPLSSGVLARYRIASRRQRRAGLVGGHQMRRKGQSLDFRDFEHYMPGDDIRHVDWRASARYGTREDLLVRHYVAEEQLSLVISMDTRSSMSLPEAMPKLQIGAWLTEAVASVALASQDRVFLHRLFGSPADSLVELRGSGVSGRIRRTLSRFASVRGGKVNTKPLRSCLTPTTVWLLISDLYFEESAETLQLAREIDRVRAGLCWVILVDLDSWPHEKILLGEGARRIDGPGLDPARNRFEITDVNLRAVEKDIRDHKNHFFALSQGASCDRVSWPWPGEQNPVPVDFFRLQFLEDKTLQRLFMKDS